MGWIVPHVVPHEDLLYEKMFGQTRAQVNKTHRWVQWTATIENSDFTDTAGELWDPQTPWLFNHILDHFGFGPSAWDEDPDPNTAPEDIPDLTDDQRARWRREAMREQLEESYEPTGALTIDELLGRIDEVLADAGD